MTKLTHTDCWLTVLLAEFISYRRQRHDHTLTCFQLRDEIKQVEDLEQYFTEAEGPVAAELLLFVRGMRQPTEALKIQQLSHLLTTSVFVEDPCVRETMFILRCEFGGSQKLATFLTLLYVQTQRYWQKPGNESGGNLHCFLEDGNFYDTFFDLSRMLDTGDFEGVVVSSLWIRIPTFLRDQLLRIMSRKFPPVISPRSVWGDQCFINIDEIPLIDDEEKITPEFVDALINGEDV